jgi:hypothetical protein
MRFPIQPIATPEDCPNENGSPASRAAACAAAATGTGIAVSWLIDVRIVDDELEAAFIEDSVRAAQKGRHRSGFLWCLFCLVGLLLGAGARLSILDQSIQTSMDSVFRAGGSSRTWIVVVAYVTCLVTFGAGVHLVWRAERYTLAAYRTRMLWIATIGYYGSLTFGFGIPGLLDQVRHQAMQLTGDGSAFSYGHPLEWTFSGWYTFILNIAYPCFFLSFDCASNRLQAVASIVSWFAGIAVVASTAESKFFLFPFISLHTVCCLGVTVAYVVFGKMQRKVFLYANMLVAEVKSEREQKAEERAVGEQAVCNWVCHEIRNPLNALQFCIEEVTKDHSLVETHTGTMQQCSKHILSVITSMLELSKLTEGKISHSTLLAPAL